MFFFNYPMEAFGEQIFLYMDYLQIPLIIIFIKILHSIWMALENYSMTNYNVNDPIIVQNWWIRRYLRLPERKSKEAIMLEILFTVGPLVMISYIILQNTGLSVGDNTTWNISSQSDNAILKAQGNQWYWDYEFIIKKVNKLNETKVLNLNNTNSNLDNKYQNLNINFNKTMDNLITKAQSIPTKHKLNYIYEALKYMKTSIIRNKITINLKYMIYILQEFLGWKNINQIYGSFPINWQTSALWKLNYSIKLGIPKVMLLWNIINGLWLDQFIFSSLHKPNEYLNVTLNNNNLITYKVKDILSLYTIQQLKQLKLLEHQLKNISLIILNQLSLNKEHISLSTIEVLTQIFKKWLVIEHKLDTCVLSQYHLNSLNKIPNFNSWLSLKWDSYKINTNIWQNLILDIKKKYSFKSNNRNVLSVSYLYTKNRSTYLYGVLLNKNKWNLNIYLSKYNVTINNRVKATKAFFFYKHNNHFNSFILNSSVWEESKKIFSKFSLDFKIIKPYLHKTIAINKNFNFIKKLILFNIYNHNKNYIRFYSYDLNNIFKETLLKIVILNYKNSNLNLILQYSLSIGFLYYILESLNINIPLSYVIKNIKYSIVFSNPSFICSNISEKLIETNYYKNLLLINNKFRLTLIDSLLEKTLTAYNTIDFIYSKNLKLDIITAYKKKIFFKIVNLHLQKFNNKLTLIYLNNSIKLYKTFVTNKFNPITKLWYTMHKPNFAKRFNYLINTLSENYPVLKKKKFNLLKWGLPKFPKFFFDNYIYSNIKTKKLQIKHILKLVFHLQDIIPNPIKINFNIADFFLGYYFLPIGSFIQELNKISGFEETTKIELPGNNIDNLNSWKRYHFEAYMLDTNDLENSNKRLMQTTTIVPFPEGVATKVLVTSSDVIHSWGVPTAGIKTDGTPGRLVEVSLILDNVGEISGRCYELCGAYHGFMPIVLGCIPKELFFEASDFIFPSSN